LVYARKEKSRSSNLIVHYSRHDRFSLHDVKWALSKYTARLLIPDTEFYTPHYHRFKLQASVTLAFQWLVFLVFRPSFTYSSPMSSFVCRVRKENGKACFQFSARNLDLLTIGFILEVGGRCEDALRIPRSSATMYTQSSPYVPVPQHDGFGISMARKPRLKHHGGTLAATD
jgi:hypothetical protein